MTRQVRLDPDVVALLLDKEPDLSLSAGANKQLRAALGTRSVVGAENVVQREVNATVRRALPMKPRSGWRERIR